MIIQILLFDDKMPIQDFIQYRQQFNIQVFTSYFMLINHNYKKYPNTISKTLLLHDKQNIKRKQKNRILGSMSINPCRSNQNIHFKVETSNFKVKQATMSNEMQDQNNSDLANRILINKQNVKCDKALEKAKQNKILQLINAYSSHQREKYQNKSSQTENEQNLKLKVYIHKKIKIIKKQFSEKDDRQILKLRIMRKRMFLKRKSHYFSKDSQHQSLNQEDQYQNFHIYKDEQIFSEMNDQFTSMTVAHCLDNDIESDDEQVQRAIKKMTNFLSDSIRTANFVEIMRQEHQALMNQEESQ